MSQCKESLTLEKLSQPSQVFETERFTVALLTPSEANLLLGVLLQDEALAAELPWMKSHSQDDALREAFGIQLQCAAKQAKVWGIYEREHRVPLGALLARSTLEGIDLEVLVASECWNHDVADEASVPVMEWLTENTEMNLAMH